MANRIITIYCADETMQKSSSVAGAAGSSNAVTLRLSFSAAWDGTTKKVYFYDATKAKSAYIICTTDKLVTGETDVYDIPIPAEALDVAGKMLLTVKGVVVSGSTVERCMMSATTTMDVLRADTPNADTAPVEPTPTQSEQLQSEIDGIKSDLAGIPTAVTAAANSATAASTSATAAQTAQAASESARDLAVSAKTAAQTAETNAETAQAAAETARTGAQTAETNAGTYATNAGNSATSAAGSATDAQSAQAV